MPSDKSSNLPSAVTICAACTDAVGEWSAYTDDCASSLTPCAPLVFVSVDALLSDASIEAAARTHADWEGLPEWKGSVLKQARAVVLAAVNATTGETHA